MLEPDNVKREGLAYIGLCLTRNARGNTDTMAQDSSVSDASDGGSTNPKSITRQDSFDFNRIQDRYVIVLLLLLLLLLLLPLLF